MRKYNFNVDNGLLDIHFNSVSAVIVSHLLELESVFGKCSSDTVSRFMQVRQNNIVTIELVSFILAVDFGTIRSGDHNISCSSRINRDLSVDTDTKHGLRAFVSSRRSSSNGNY